MIVAACIFASLVVHVIACRGWWAWRCYALRLEGEAEARALRHLPMISDALVAKGLPHGTRLVCNREGCELCDPGQLGGIRDPLPLPVDRDEARQ